MTVTIAILLLSWLCFDGGLSTDNTNHRLPGRMLDRIKLYAKHAAWYVKNHYDGYPESKRYDEQQLQKYKHELQQLFVPTHMNLHDMDALLNFIYKASALYIPLLQRIRDTESLHQQMREARGEFRNSTFGPSEYMIEHIHNLAEHSARVAWNDREGYQSDERNSIRRIEQIYQALRAAPHHRSFAVYANKYPIGWPAVHVGIQVNGREYFFDGDGQGVISCTPRRWNGQNAEETVFIGRAEMSEPDIENIISWLSRYHYTAGLDGGRTQYDFGTHNCQDFAHHFAKELGCLEGIPLHWRQTEIIGRYTPLGPLYWVLSGRAFS